jgi:tripartite-type tricarboxylate transporter receptor subunit TctC
MLKRCMLLSLPVLVFLSGAAQAQEFPSRTVTIVSPYQAGGTSDVIVRVLAQTLGDMWGKTVVVENRPGANGAIGAGAARWTYVARGRVERARAQSNLLSQAHL